MKWQSGVWWFAYVAFAVLAYACGSDASPTSGGNDTGAGGSAGTSGDAGTGRVERDAGPANDAGIDPVDGSSDAALPPAGDPGVAERRCDELGDACLVSEPMNTGDFQVDCQTGKEDIDFADTEGPGAKEADKPYNQCDRQFPVATNVEDVDLPTGASVIGHVLRVDPDTINRMYHRGANVPGGKRRVCMRVYRKFSANYAGFGECGANKQQEFWGSQTAVQVSEGGSSSSFRAWAATEGVLPATGGVTFRDCTDNWCRQEICISTSDDDIKSFNNITVDGYVTQVGVDGAPLRVDFPATFIGSPRGSLGELWVTTGYRERCGNSDPTVNGYHYVSHGMVAVWDEDEGQYIGVAEEVEGTR